MKRYLSIILLSLPLLFFASCGQDENEPFNQKFIHIMMNETSSEVIPSDAIRLSTYNVYLSSSKLSTSLEVNFEIVVGDGLKEGVDFQMITTGNQLVFFPGIYDMPIRIKWISHLLDPTKDNTLKIVLVSNNQDITLGLPGPDHLQRAFTITKMNK
jgi:hypothetical protein